ncbi:MAG: PIN domain-containing protein [Nitrospirota bacterium]
MLVGVDTGFFYLVRDDHPSALKILEEETIITSSIVIYELQKKILQRDFKESFLLDKIEQSIYIISININIAKKAAYISHNFGIHGLDALILSSLLQAGCKEIYTVDPHFEKFKEKDIKIILLK